MKGLNLLKYIFWKEDTLWIPDALITTSNWYTVLKTPVYSTDLTTYLLKTGITTKTVTVALWGTSWVTVADTAIIWGTILGIVPTWNQDQFVDNIAINGSWVLTVTLAAAATADNTFRVSILKA